MATLIVTLSPQPAAPATEFPWLLTPDGATLADHGTAVAALLPPASGAGAEVVAVVPGAMVSWHAVDLPKGTAAGSPRLRAVLEGLLEDRLLDETEAIHFALQPQARPGAPVWVAACSRAWLRQALQFLEAAGRPVSRIVPEFTPEEALQLHVTGPHAASDSQQARLVLAGPQGVLALPLAAQALALLPADGADAPLSAEPGAAALAEQVLQRPVRIEQAAQRWLRAARSGWDLAQFDMATSGRSRAFKRLATGAMELLRAALAPARWGAGLLVALNLLGLNAWAWREHTVLEGKRDAIRNTLTQTFPAVKVVVDAPVQMEREVAALRQVTGASSPRDLEAMLGALTQAAGTERPVAAIDYVPGELRARGSGYGPEAAGALAPGLQGLGYSAQTDGGGLVIRAEGAR